MYTAHTRVRYQHSQTRHVRLTQVRLSIHGAAQTHLDVSHLDVTIMQMSALEG